MLFTITWEGCPETRNKDIRRFLDSGGGLPPAGVKMIGRWHDLASISGVAVAETNDAALMAQWALEWSDLLRLQVRQVLDDAQFGALVANLEV